MILSEVSIRRPVLAIMMSLAIVLFGLVSLSRLPVRELPDVDPPIVNVATVYPGADAKVVETEVTEKLEEAINNVEGIKRLTSQSREQVSSITVEFNLARDIELAAQDVRDRVSRVRGTLPDEIEEPVVAKQDADANPVMWIALFSDQYSTLELTSFAEDLMKDRLQTVKGVSSIFIGGQKRFAIRIRLDSEKMAARQITVTDVDRALKTQNVELPSGRVENLDREMTILTRGELKTADEFNRLVIRREGDAFIRLQDIGLAEVGVENERGLARFNSKPSVGLGIVKQSKANTIEVAQGIKRELDRLIPLLPPGVETFLPYDESIFVEKSIHEVWVTLFIAFVLVVITIFVFLRNVGSTLIPCLTIPVAIIGTYLVLSIMGYSVNILTMLALVLAIGIVVDDSIVVLENIYRHIEEGMQPMEAAVQGMREIGFAVIAVTLALCAVFIPLAFQTTLTGRLFIEFAIALTGSVLISAFVALTLTPTVAARVLKPHGDRQHGRLFSFFERGFDHFTDHYRRMLTRALDHRVAVVVASLLVFALSGLFYVLLDKEFLPEEDKGLMLVFMAGPEGSTSEYSDRTLQEVESIVSSTPEVDGYFCAVGLAREGPGKVNEGFMFLRLKPDRERSVSDIVQGPQGLGARFFGGVKDAFTIPIIPKAVSRGFGQPLQLVLQEPDLEKLDGVSQEIGNKLRAGGYLANVRSSYEVTKPELRISIDRDRAAALDVSVEDIARTLQIMFGGLDLSKIKRGGKEYDVIVQLERRSRQTPADLERLYIRSGRGELVQMANVVTYQTAAGPTSINHFNRFRSATLEATPVGLPLGEAVGRVEAMLREQYPQLRYEWTGETADLRDAGQGFAFVVGLAIIVVYMVLASQFESLLHPFTIMLTLPLAAFGAFTLLWLLNGVNMLGQMFYAMANYAPDPPAFARVLSHVVPRIPAMNMNLFSQIGIVLLIGLATKNSILLVEFANQRMAKGASARDAMLQAGLIRFRPILMTSFTTILGVLPIAIGWGAGGESRRPMGVAAVGGLLTSTFLTLLVVPVAYTLFAEWGAKLRRRRPAGVPAASIAVTGLLFLLGLSMPARGQETNETSAAVKRYDLPHCIATALDGNYDVRQAQERVRRQYGAVVEVRARMLPNLALNGAYEDSDPDLSSLGEISLPTESWNLGLRVTQSIYAGGRNRAGYRAQKSLEEAAIQDLQASLNDVLLSVRERYYAVLLARSQIRVQEQNIQLLEEELGSASNKLAVGAVSPFNVLRAEVALANGHTPLIRARNNYRVAIEELSRVLGLDPDVQKEDRGIEVVGELSFQPYAADLSKERASALEHRPEMKRLGLLIEAQKQSLEGERGGYKPELSAFAGYGYEKDRGSEDTWDKVDGWRAGLQMNWDLWDGQLTRGRTLRAASELELAKLEADETRLNIDVEVRRTHSSLVEATELVHATRKVVEQALESVRLARSRFDVGAATQLDVLQTQQALTQARDNEVQALHDYNVALARLRKAMGVMDSVRTESAPPETAE